MRERVLEGSVYFLLFFTPFAFGGVETWAVGVLQIASGIIFAAWAWSWWAGSIPLVPWSQRAARQSRWVWVPVVLFFVLVLFQMVPLPPAAVQSLSPATHRLYADTLPGYAEGNGFDTAELPAWLLEHQQARIPGMGTASARALAESAGPEAASSVSAWRTLSVYPFESRKLLTLFLCYAALFAAIAGHFRTKEQILRLLKLAVLSGMTVSLFGIVQKLSWNEKLYWIRQGNYKTVFGPFVNANNYAAFAGIALPIAICLGFRSLKQVKSGRQGEMPALIFFLFSAVLLAAGILYSGSRGGILAAGVGLLLVAGFSLYYRRGRFELSLLGGLLLASVLLLVWLGPETVVDRLSTLSEGQRTPSLVQRLSAWDHSVDLMSDHTMFGTGLGTFPFAFVRYGPPGRDWWTLAHNEYIELVCDTGAIGGLLFLWGLGSYLLVVLRPRRFRGRSRSYIYSGLLVALVVILLHSMVTSNLHIPAIGVMVAVLAASLHNVVLFQRQRQHGAGHKRARA